MSAVAMNDFYYVFFYIELSSKAQIQLFNHCTSNREYKNKFVIASPYIQGLSTYGICIWIG